MSVHSYSVWATKLHCLHRLDKLVIAFLISGNHT